MALRELTEICHSDPLTEAHIIDVERAIAIASASPPLSPSLIRSSYWEPLADVILSRSETDVGLLAFVISSIDKAMTTGESYDRSNFMMEILRRAITAGNPAFNWPNYRTATMAYDPFIKNVASPSFDDLKRHFLDIDLVTTVFDEPTGGEARDRAGVRGRREAEAATPTLPQAIPGLGNLSSSDKYPLTDGEGLQSYLVALTTGQTKGAAPSFRADAATLAGWLDRLSVDLGIRIALINMAFSLSSTTSIIKHLTEVIRVDMESRGKIITADMIKRTYPFEFPPSELDEPHVFTTGESHRIFGEKGSLYVVLDYRYGTNRYLPLFMKGGTRPLPPTATLATLKHLSPVPPEENLQIVHTLQHVKFVGHYIRPSLEDVLLPAKQVVRFELPYPDAPVADAAFAAAEKYISMFEGAVRAAGITGSDRIIRARRTMYLDLLRRAIDQDVANDIRPFNPGSESEKVMDRFEAYFQRIVAPST